MSKDVVLTRQEYDELYDLLEKFQAIVESPAEYRKYYRDSLGKGELLESFREEIVNYAKNESSFERYMMENLGESITGGSAAVARTSDAWNAGQRPLSGRASTSIRGGTLTRHSTHVATHGPSLQPHSIFSPRASSRPLLRN